MLNNGWNLSVDVLPQENEEVLILDFVPGDVIVDWAIYKNNKFYLIIGASLCMPQYWRNDIKLPEFKIQ